MLRLTKSRHKPIRSHVARASFLLPSLVLDAGWEEKARKSCLVRDLTLLLFFDCASKGLFVFWKLEPTWLSGIGCTAASFRMTFLCDVVLWLRWDHDNILQDLLIQLFPLTFAELFVLIIPVRKLCKFGQSLKNVLSRSKIETYLKSFSEVYYNL